jgi:putative endonuclease
MMDQAEVGAAAEEQACRVLRAKGYLIVARNWRTRFGEIDIVARDGEVLVFVEVKARSGSGYGGAEGAVGPAKQRRMIAAAKAFLAANRCELASRFDVVAMEGNDVRILRDAFQVDDVWPSS